jgi:membrane protein
MIREAFRLLRFVRLLAEEVWWYGRAIARKIASDDVIFLASGIAFNGILTIIPLLFLGAAGIGSILNSSEFAVSRVNDILNTMFPPQPFATSIKESLAMMITDIVDHRHTIGLFGILVLFYTATFLFDAVRSVLHTVYRVPKTRGILSSLFRHVGFVVLAFILFIGSTVAVWAVSVLRGIVRNVPAFASLELPGLDSTVITTTVMVLTAFMFYVIFRHIPDTMPPRAAAVISTITTTFLWVASGKLFAVYLMSFSAIGTIYGPYAFILVLLIWVYYSSLIFVIGAIVGQAYWERSLMPGRPSLRLKDM